MKKEVYISVDIEADGPIPGDYSMVALGACMVQNPDVNFYRELKPISNRFISEALAVSGLNRDKLMEGGADPIIAMREFANWLGNVCQENERPIFVAFNATFDWMFVHWYFVHFLGHDPFGISGWDIKAYYAGVTRAKFWGDTAKTKMDKKFRSQKRHTHNALDDAQEQAEIFQRIHDATQGK